MSASCVWSKRGRKPGAPLPSLDDEQREGLQSSFCDDCFLALGKNLLQAQGEHGRVGAGGGAVQRRPAALGGEVGVRAQLQQPPHAPHLPARDHQQPRRARTGACMLRHKNETHQMIRYVNALQRTVRRAGERVVAIKP
ncbi:Protein of unknown function [Gryllus bimaculatus]|nr:Protein of unknown function [Gryllus bimaculatus]